MPTSTWPGQIRLSRTSQELQDLILCSLKVPRRLRRCSRCPPSAGVSPQLGHCRLRNRRAERQRRRPARALTRDECASNSFAPGCRWRAGRADAIYGGRALRSRKWNWRQSMKELVPPTRKSKRFGRFGLALAALIAVGAVAPPALPALHGGAAFSFGFSPAPAYPYYYAPAPRYYYAPPPRYYYAPPP